MSKWGGLQIEQTGFPPNILTSWITFYKNFESLLITGKNNRQLVECFRSYDEAMRASQLEFKIPNLVRSIESVVDCWGAKEFAQRVLHLIGTLAPALPYSISVSTQQLLEDLYQLRNDCSHGKPFAYSLEKKNGTAPTEQLIAQYEFLGEFVARKILNIGLTNSSILSSTKNRDDLVSAWKTGSIRP